MADFMLMPKWHAFFTINYSLFLKVFFTAKLYKGNSPQSRKERKGKQDVINKLPLTNLVRSFHTLSIRFLSVLCVFAVDYC